MTTKQIKQLEAVMKQLDKLMDSVDIQTYAELQTAWAKLEEIKEKQN
jgi:hypothetical protein